MTEYDFLLRFDLPDPSVNPERFVESLYEAGCDDATVGIGQHGRIALSFRLDDVTAGRPIRPFICCLRASRVFHHSQPPSAAPPATTSATNDQREHESEDGGGERRDETEHAADRSGRLRENPAWNCRDRCCWSFMWLLCGVGLDEDASLAKN